MGTTEVLQILQKGDKLTASEISELVEATLGAVHVSMRRLLKDVSVNLHVEFLTPEQKIERYGKVIGRSIKIYCLDE